jgi:hypothetical protein
MAVFWVVVPIIALTMQAASTTVTPGYTAQQPRRQISSFSLP